MAIKNKNTTQESTKTVEEVVETTEPKVDKVVEQKRKRIDVSKKRDVEVAFMNNTNGIFYYEDPRTKEQYQLSEYGDVDYITIGELQKMASGSTKKMLTDYWIVLIDVLDEEIELEDVLKYLGLQNQYNDVLNGDEMDKFIVQSEYLKFEDALSKMEKSMIERVTERAVALFRMDKFRDMGKMNKIQEYVGNDHLFSDVQKQK